MDHNRQDISLPPVGPLTGDRDDQPEREVRPPERRCPPKITEARMGQCELELLRKPSEGCLGGALEPVGQGAHLGGPPPPAL